VTLAWSYDEANNVTRKLYSDGTDLQFTYDSVDRLISTNNLTLTRDAEGRVTATTDSSVVFGASYDDGGQLKTATYNNGAFTVTYTYDSTTGLLTQVTDDLTNSQVGFTYDNDQMLTGLTRSNGVNATFTRDAAERITRIQEGSLIDIQYTLDAAGQVTRVDMTVPLDPVTLFTSGADSSSYDGACQMSGTNYSYDGLGRLTQSSGNTYGWDGDSRLTGINQVTLDYNGLGDLITRTEGGTTQHYYYNDAIALNPMVAEQNETTGQFERYYVWTPGGSLLYVIDAANGNKTYFYHFDRIGSTLALTDSSGALTDSYGYSPYGKLLSHSGSSSQPFTFVGRYGVRQEGTSGALYHMRARYYDAETARFLSREVVWPDLVEPQRLNPYQYAQESPLMFVDETGMEITPAEKKYVNDLLSQLKLLREVRLKAEQAIRGVAADLKGALEEKHSIRSYDQRTRGIGEVADYMENVTDLVGKIPGVKVKGEALNLVMAPVFGFMRWASEVGQERAKRFKMQNRADINRLKAQLIKGLQLHNKIANQIKRLKEELRFARDLLHGGKRGTARKLYDRIMKKILKALKIRDVHRLRIFVWDEYREVAGFNERIRRVNAW
jgi:RHS repeat-associated protein